MNDDGGDIDKGNCQKKEEEVQKKDILTWE